MPVHQQEGQHGEDLDDGVDGEPDAEGAAAGQQPGSERDDNDHQQPDHVQCDDARVESVHVPEEPVVRPPVAAYDHEADQELEVAQAVPP